MKQLLLRILKNGTIVAVILAIFGYLMASVAGVWLTGQPGMSRSASSNAEELVANLQTRVPIAVAAWGFVLVAGFELVLFLIRGNPKPAATSTNASAPAPGSNAEVDALYNKLLGDAERQRTNPEPHS